MVAVKAENGRIAAAYNEDGFNRVNIYSTSHYWNGIIASIEGSYRYLEKNVVEC